MKILWLCNIMLPKIASHLQKSVPNVGGWLTGLSDSLLTKSDVELIICFPDNQKIMQGNVDGLKYYSFVKKNIVKYDFENENYFREILENEKPDIVHIFGTEYPHSLEMVNAFNSPKRTIINIQGLVSVYSQHFFASLPFSVIHRYSFKDFIKGKNLVGQRNDFIKRGKFEELALKNVDNIIGRTEWDKACTKFINYEATYYHCNESLRNEFYMHDWSLEKCEKFSIFLSQANYPIKGLHRMLDALKIVMKYYPNTKLYIAGSNITGNKTVKEKIAISSYGLFLNKIIKKNNMSNNIMFLGNLNEHEMCTRYLNSHIFVCPSSIENSPNSVGEAMILGVPTITSDVGGVKNLLNHGEEGYIFPSDEAYMLAYYILEIFSNDNIAIKVSKNAKIKASQIHNRNQNNIQLVNIYKNVLEKEL